MLVARALDIAVPDDRPGHVLDMFAGSGTTAAVCAGINDYVPIARKEPIHCTLIERDPKIVARYILPRLSHVETVVHEEAAQVYS